MNATTTGAAERSADKAPSPLFVLFLLLGLLAAAAGIAALGLSLQRKEAGLLVDELFGAEPRLPYGLVPQSGMTTALQQRSVRLARPADAEPVADAPDEVVVQRYAGSAPVARLFDPVAMAPAETARQVEEWRKEPTRDFEVTVARGEIEFGRWRVDHVHARLYGKDGRTRDVVRVNVTVGDLTQVLFAFWPYGVTAEPRRLAPLLESIRFDALWEDYQERLKSSDGVDRGAARVTNVPR